MSEGVREHATRTPHAVALRDGTSSELTFAAVDLTVDRLVSLLRAHSVRPGDRICWVLHNRIEVLVLALAAQRLGALTVPLSYRASPGEFERMLAVARPRILVVERTTARLVPVTATACNRLDLDDPALDFTSWPVDERAAEPSGTDRLGAGSSLIFTSGTTGSPKAAVRTRGDRELAEAIARGFGIGDGSNFLSAGPLYHSGPLTCALMVLAKGGAVTVLPRFDAREWVAAAAKHECDGAFLTPSQLRAIVEVAERDKHRPTGLRHVIVSGEPFPGELKRRAVAAFGLVFLDCYGCTELGPLTVMPAADLLRRPRSCGKPFPGVAVRAFDGDRELGAGETGVLRARTPLSFTGYRGAYGDHPAESPGGWASVGDIGYLDERGYVYVVDRGNDLIISGGVNIYPADVEAVLLDHPAVRQCVVVGVPDERWGEAVCATVVTSADLTLDQLRTWLIGRLADDKRPRRLVRVAELPLNDTGKISRKRVREMLVARSEMRVR
ncbi:class I adenylate-forming enzyme family protein [Amycolatopsis sp. CA-230715]|uniref:class I adenylate-forming enzyme family protein n=1 Tax=Amycolatopsis sp. CA-230715 TaxID=2745196 RepID=UPI001C0341AB|nr:AMP-binding protein [Amycolatopsis sp. CA-230715]QWF84780.1 putative acyl--CoA ligase YhfT [Amycolatopsis sp. CA-230715]